MKQLAISTQRLSVHHWDTALNAPDRHAQLKRDLHAMLTPPVLQHLPPSVQLDGTQNAIGNWITGRQATTDVYLVTASSTLIGLLFLFNSPQADGDLNLGYLFSENAWGQGYASELVAGLVQALGNDFNGRIHGGVAIDNPASARVLEKAGFVPNPDLTTPDTLFLTYDTAFAHP